MRTCRPPFLSAEVSLLDPPLPAKVRLKPDTTAQSTSTKSKRARKGRGGPETVSAETEVPDFVKEIGSSGWIRTSNPPVNSCGAGFSDGVVPCRNVSYCQ